MNMENDFKNYLKQTRQEFAKVAAKYSTQEHRELRTSIDDLLIAYDQATEKALIIAHVAKIEMECEHNWAYHDHSDYFGTIQKCKKCGKLSK